MATIPPTETTRNGKPSFSIPISSATSDATSRKKPLKWERNCFNRAPEWPREPDLAVIKSLAKKHLASELPRASEGAEPKISDFASGVFNKLYLVSYSGHDASYLFRATLSVIPFYKTENEVATLAYLRAKTSIPVPRVIAWNSSADNDLGFEWILMDKIAGVELGSVWRRMPWQRKMELMDQLAGFIHELGTHTFSAIGSLYFKSALESQEGGRNHNLIYALPENPPKEDELADLSTRPKSERTAIAIPSTLHAANIETQSATEQIEGAKYVSDTSCTSMPKIQGQVQGFGCGNAEVKECETISVVSNLQGDDEFVIGPIFSWIFWSGTRLYTPGPRGPYQSCSEWYEALMEMLITWFNAGRVEDDSEYDSDCETESPDMLVWRQQYLDILTAVCLKQEDYSLSSLHHNHLNKANILVDPETFAITGIVEWETTNIVPNWRATGYPEFIETPDPPCDKEPPIPSFGEGQTLKNGMRDQWDNRILRGRFDQAMKQLSTSYESSMASKSRETKRAFELNIGNLTDWPQKSQNWLKRYKDANKLVKKIKEKRGDLGKNGAGTGHSLRKEIPSAEQNRFGNVAHDEPETDTTAQTAEQAMPANITTESQPVNGPVGEHDTPWKRLTQEEAHSPASDTTTSSWSSTPLEGLVHKVALGRPIPIVGEKVSKGGSSSGSKYLEETQKLLTELIAMMKKATSSKFPGIITDYAGPAEKTAQMEEEWPTSSNISEAGTGYAKPTEKTVKSDDEALPTCSNASEAGSDYTPLMRDGESDWKENSRVS